MSKRNRLLCMCCFMICIYVLFSLPVQAVDIGKDAPDITAETWFNGGPYHPSVSDDKTIYVIVFWATWDRSNRKLFPFLNKLHENGKKKNVVVIGISQEPASSVGMFLAKAGAEFPAAADKHRTTTRKYMKGHTGVPKAFVVDKKGTVVWVGHPMVGLKTALARLLAGTFDRKSLMEIQSLENKLRKAVKTGDTGSMYIIIREILRKQPYEYKYHCIKRDILKVRKDRSGLKKAYEEMVKTFAGDPKILLDIAEQMIIDKNEKFRFPETALVAARIAVFLTKKTKSRAYRVLGRVYLEMGLVDPAVACQEQAIAHSPDAVDREKQQTVLEYYKRIQSLNRKYQSQKSKPDSRGK